MKNYYTILIFTILVISTTLTLGLLFEKNNEIKNHDYLSPIEARGIVFRDNNLLRNETNSENQLVNNLEDTIQNAPITLFNRKPDDNQQCSQNKYLQLQKEKIEQGSKESDNSEYTIGTSLQKPIYNPADEIFHVWLDSSFNIENNSTIILEYELYGIEDYTQIARSINDQPAMGGYFVKQNNSWKKQQEKISPKIVKPGNNIVRFSIPKDQTYSYKIKNVELKQVPNNEMLQRRGQLSIQKDDIRSLPQQKIKKERRLAINQPTTAYYYKEYGYLQGFVYGDGSERAIITIGNTTLKNHKGEFEGLAKKSERQKTSSLDNANNSSWKVQVTATFPDGEELSIEASFNESVEYDYINSFDPTIHYAEAIFEQNKNFNLNLLDAHIFFDSCALADYGTTLSITALRDIDFAKPRGDMINVTGGAEGYRFLPHGTQFEKPVLIALGYDSSLIRSGYRPSDIRTYFFDEQELVWKILSVHHIDEQKQLVYSVTTHFTDMINALIQVPETPQGEAFTPTMLSGLEVANPSNRIPMMQPPTANNQGTANLTYPIEIPQGRQGVQPTIGIQYSSDAGNGLLGVGWNMTVPCISVDTRWGVPKFDRYDESETYLLNGEQLSPTSHRENWVPRSNSGKKEFFARVEGEFNRIIRYGDQPSNYWWEVTDKKGIRYRYGSIDGKSQYQSAILKNENGVAIWYLSEIRDRHDNVARYHYSTKTIKNSQGNYRGKYIALDSIKYTGHDAKSFEEEGSFDPYVINRHSPFSYEEGKYTVVFNYIPRKDIIVNYKYGCEYAIGNLLSSIDTKFKNELIDRVGFMYKNGAFDKALLEKIVHDRNFMYDPRWDTIVVDKYTTRYEYHEYRFTDTNRVHTFEYYDEVRNSDGTYKSLFKPAEIWKSPQDNIKWTFEDSGVGWKALSLLFSANGKDMAPSGIGSSQSISAGAGGNISIGAFANVFSKGLSGSGFYRYNTSKSETMLTMFDVNGDGLPDKVFKKDKKIYYRQQLRNPNAEGLMFGPAFLILVDGGKSLDNLMVEVGSSHSYGLEGNLVAVYGGKGEERSKSRVSTYTTDINGDGLQDFIVDGNVIFNQFYPETCPTSPGVICSYEEDKEVISGTIPFGISSKETANPIEEIGEVSREVIPEFYDKTQSPLHDVVRMWVAPYTGTVMMKADVRLIKDESLGRSLYKKADGVTAYIQHNMTLLKEIPIEAEDYEKKAYDKQLNVKAGDKIFFRLNANKDGSFDQVVWNPTIYYTHVNGSPVGNNIIAKDADGKLRYVFNASTDFVLNTTQSLDIEISGVLEISGLISLNSTEANASGYASILKNGIIEGINKVFVFNSSSKAPIPFARTINVNAGDKIEFKLKATSKERSQQVKWDPIITYKKIERNSVNNTGQVVRETVGSDSISLPIYRLRIYDTVPPNTSYGSLSRGWGQFIYNVTEKTNIKILDTADLASFNAKYGKNGDFSVEDTVKFNLGIDTSMDGHVGMEEDLESNMYADQSEFNFIKGPFLPMYADVEIGAWRGLYNNTYVKDSIMSTSRMDDDDINLEAARYISYDASESSSTPYQLLVPSENINISLDEINSVKVLNINTEEDEIINKPWKRGVDKMSEGFNKNSSWGVAPIVLSLGKTHVTGSHKSLNEIIDMNGDGYPDIIGRGNIQYTYPTGRLSNNLLEGQEESFHNTSLSTNGVTKAVNGEFFIIPKVGDKNGDAGKTKFKGGTASGSISLDENVTSDEASHSYIDMNGDGLPDRVYQNGEVELNLGYSFSTPQNWGFTGVRKAGSVSNSVSGGSSFQLGEHEEWATAMEAIMNSGLKDLLEGTNKNFSRGSTSFSGGAGSSFSTNHTEVYFADVNGDGLPDNITGINPFKVRLNTGSGFGNEISWKIPSRSSSHSFCVNIAGTGGVSVWFVKFTATPQVNASQSTSREHTSLIDMDGDGFPDFVESGEEGKLFVSRSRIGRTNMLKKVTLPLKATYDLTYAATPPSVRTPGSKWVLNSVEIFDGFVGDGTNKLLTTFEYNCGYYNRYERTSYGFRTVKIFEHNTSTSGNPVYRTTINSYNNKNYYQKGLLDSSIVLTGGCSKYLQTINTYQLIDPAVTESIDINYSNSTMFFYDGYQRDSATMYEVESLSELTTDRAFSALTRTVTNYFEGSYIAHKSHTKTFKYGEYGNIIKQIDYGHEAVNDSVLELEIEYFPDYYLSLDANNDPLFHKSTYAVGVPKTTIISSNKKILRKVSCRAYRAPVDITYISINTNASDSGKIEISLNYDYIVSYSQGEYLGYYGNIVRAVSPGYSEFKYTYDPEVYTYPQSITSPFGGETENEYNYHFGKPTKITDINKQVMQYEYDLIGRLINVKAPNEIAKNVPYTIRYDYAWQGAIPYVLTEHYNPDYPEDPMQTLCYSDGLGRAIQSKKESSINGTSAAVVSGKTVYDFLGRAIRNYDVMAENIIESINRSTGKKTTELKKTLRSMDLPWVFPTEMQYDLMDRVVRTTLPDGVTILSTYGFDTDAFGDMQFLTTITDGNGNTTKSFTDMRGQNTSITDASGGKTKFSYNAIGDLISSADPEGNITKNDYDLMGRRIKRTQPDAGTTRYAYDKAGNITKLINAANDTIYYNYDYQTNTLESINYSRYPEQNASFVYGKYPQDTSSKGVGKLIEQKDLSGIQKYKYGPMGELVENTRTFVIPKESPLTFVTKWEYDSWNRIKSINYPDGEILKYIYGQQGDLQTIKGTKNNHEYIYLKNQRYDRWGNLIYSDNGNGVITEYEFYPDKKNLSNLDIKGHEFFASNEYYYDNNDNIKELNKYITTNFPNSGFVRSQYFYDNLNRLEESYEFQNDGAETSLRMNYSPSGNINTKEQFVLNPLEEVQKFVSKQYYYNPQKPHVPEMVEDFYKGTLDIHEADKNGNLTLSISDKFHERTFDEGNRLLGVTGMDGYESPFVIQQYTYDANGERAIKYHLSERKVKVNNYTSYTLLSADGYSLYVNPYLSVKDGNYTKHIYNNGKRIASHLAYRNINAERGSSNISLSDKAVLQEKHKQMFAKVNKKDTSKIEFNYMNYHSDDVCTEPNGAENLRFFYHTDHLGGTNFITEPGGLLYQRFEYTPFGEKWIEERFPILYSYGDEETDEYSGEPSKWVDYTTWDYHFVNTPYRFTGQELDELTGLYYYGARYYDPQLSMFMSMDPMAEVQPWQSPYAYCSNNPINRVDPTGMLDGWVEDPNNPDKGTYHDPTVNSPKAAADKGLKYHGQTTLLTPQGSDKVVYGDQYGDIHDVMPIAGLTIKAEMTDHQRTMSNPLVKNIHQSHYDFWNTIAGLFDYMNDFKYPHERNPNLVTGTAPVPSFKGTSVVKTVKSIPKGFKLTKKFGFQRGQKVYKYGGRYYSKDIDAHNGGVWKVFEESGGKLKRIGTTDRNLNIIKK